MLVEFGAVELGKMSVTINYRSFRGPIDGTPMSVFLDRSTLATLTFSGSEDGRSKTVSVPKSGKLRVVCTVTSAFSEPATEGEIILRDADGNLVDRIKYKSDPKKGDLGGTYYDEWQV